MICHQLATRVHRPAAAGKQQALPQTRGALPKHCQQRQHRAICASATTAAPMAKGSDVQPPSVTEQPLLLYNWVCPFVHRVTLALALKGVSLPKVDIDLRNKPSWLTQYSPMGKVPAITYMEDGKQQVLYESLALVFWVDEYFKQGPSLMPQSPAQRAKARIACARFDGTMALAQIQALKAQTLEEFKEALAKVRAEFTWLEENSALADGSPFLTGEQPGLVDAVIGPWLLRAPMYKAYKNVELLAKHPKLQAYTERFRQLPAVQSTFLPANSSEPNWEEWSQGMVQGYLMYAKQKQDFSAVDAA